MGSIQVDRVEDWRANCRLRWVFHSFRSGPQSGCQSRFQPCAPQLLDSNGSGVIRFRSLSAARSSHSRRRQRMLVMQTTEYCFGTHRFEIAEAMPGLPD